MRRKKGRFTVHTHTHIYLNYAAHLQQRDLDYLASGGNITFTETQQVELERNFQCNHFILPRERFAIACQLRLPEMAVKDWFKNRLEKFETECVQKGMPLRSRTK